MESTEPLKSKASSKAPGERVARNVDIKTRKGKKCGQQKPIVPKNPDPPGGTYIFDKFGFHHIPKTNAKKWQKISFALLPIVAAVSAFILTQTNKHPKHHFVPYEYMNIRNRRFPWGGGKLSLLHGANNFGPKEEGKTSDNKAQ